MVQKYYANYLLLYNPIVQQYFSHRQRSASVQPCVTDVCARVRSYSNRISRALMFFGCSSIYIAIYYGPNKNQFVLPLKKQNKFSIHAYTHFFRSKIHQVPSHRSRTHCSHRGQTRRQIPHRHLHRVQKKKKILAAPTSSSDSVEAVCRMGGADAITGTRVPLSKDSLPFVGRWYRAGPVQHPRPTRSRGSICLGHRFSVKWGSRTPEMGYVGTFLG